MPLPATALPYCYLAEYLCRSVTVGSKIKVVLTQDVANLGVAGEIREVSGGYGRNYLIPRGMAVLATRGQIRQAEERLAAQRRREEATRRDAQAIAARLHGQTLRFTARVGELDRLYGSITSSDIAGKIGEILGVEFDRRKIQLEEPIKRIGIYPVTIRLMAGVEAVINVVVEGEEGAIQLPPDPETV
jgi:large subunit ribosomal protein L9